jgi:hypothetical protein
MNAAQRRKFNRHNWRDCMSKIKAGGMPPTELPPLPDSRAAFRARFWRGLAKAYAVALTIVIGAIAFFS